MEHIADGPGRAGRAGQAGRVGGAAGRAVAMANNCLYLGKGSPVPEAAWAFYKLLIGKDVQPQIAQLQERTAMWLKDGYIC